MSEESEKGSDAIIGEKNPAGRDEVLRKPRRRRFEGRGKKSETIVSAWGRKRIWSLWRGAQVGEQKKGKQGPIG